MNSWLLSVVIPTYNRGSFLEKCLDCFSKQTFPRDNFEVIVIDDGSTDDTKKILTQKPFPFKLRPLFHDHGGAAKARNLGIAESLSNLIVFTDDDCFPNEQFLERHWKIHQDNAECVGRGPILVIRSLAEIVKSYQKFLGMSMNFFCTSNASVLKKNLLKVGEFDESFSRWEDAELGYRLRKAGLRYCFDMDAVVYHLKPLWKIDALIRTALSDGHNARELFKRHPSWRTWLSGGLHPASILGGKLLSPLVSWKLAQIKPEETVSGLWERLIFHAYFVRGLSK